jgi:nicotinamide-nucleotide amidase
MRGKVMADAALYRLAEELGEALKARGLMLATAESCTGGWVSEAVTMVPGSSDWFERGFVTYTYISKREMLGVDGELLGRYGAVSEEVVREMVRGALERSHAQVAVGVSGGASRVETVRFLGDREAIRRQAVEHALKGVLAQLPGREA